MGLVARVMLLVALVMAGVCGLALAQDLPAADPPGAAAPASAPQQMTLWMIMQAGGSILWVIIVLSIVTVIMVVYYLLTVTTSREVPANFVKRAMSQLQAGDLRGAYQMCEGRDEIIANVLRAGLKASGHDRYVIQEAMESEGERCATALWQRISYLNNIGVIAPLLGLLGTVWGMIGAFSAIAYSDASARGLTIASGVAQAMITTAAGLILAIPTLAVYYFLRGRVIRIISVVESQATEMIDILTSRSRES